ncbi:nitrate- and nitrite sensing domain-containing protein [Streptomyces sp. NPDC019443]|uniref:sensor histidine kinase n=1 Tax=Streptomyces sp. NPDC019443 TaxID=3365061 RepID=UPI0037B81CD8
MSFALPLVVPALFLTGLWSYTATGLVDEQIQLRADADRVVSTGRPAHSVLARLQDERRLTAAWQATRTSSSRAALDDARSSTDAAVEEFRRLSPSGLDTTALKSGAKELNDSLDTLSERRDAIDDRTLSSADAFQYFTDSIADGAGLLTDATRTDDGRTAHAVAATSLVQVTEMLSREDALISAALPSGRMASTPRAQFSQYLAIQREARKGLDARDLLTDDATAYASITDSPRWTSLASIEDAVAISGGTKLPNQATAWPDAADTVVNDLQKLNSDSLENLADTGKDRADGLLLGLILGSLATLAALAVVGALALRVWRSVISRLSQLQQKTEDLAGTRLPQLVAQLERGEQVDPTALPPRRHHATDELERLDAAIDHLAHVAADTVVHQSLGREGTEKVFSKLIRRTQTLIHRLISLLDDLERKHEDSDLLKDIFKVDHLATRVRRHSENLVILGGSPPTRRMTAPVSITDVMRSAVAETEHYTRVKVKNLPPGRRVSLAGRAVADVTHLLAELIENGTSFSPPDTQVFVSATKVARGLALHVEDHGLGMPEDHRVGANQLLAHPPELDMMTLGADPRLGHFVVARLAERHKIKVELRESVYGGTLAIVLLPAALLEEHDSPLLEQLKSAASAGSAAAGALGGTADATVQAQLQDHHGYPEYGGAGLLPAASAHPGAQAPAPPEWTPPQGHPDPEVRHPEPAMYEDAQDASPPLVTPRVLPQRTRGASLAQQLRKEAAHAQSQQDDEGETGAISPGESARTMMAIQQGMKRAQIAEADESAGVDSQAESRGPSAN